MADKDRGSTNRRAFISGAVTAGVAAALGAGAPAQRRANPRIRRPTVQTGPRRQEVTLQSLPELAVSTSTPPGREADDPVTPTPGRAPQPATKGQLLDALERAPGGDGLLERIGAPRGGTGRGGQTFDPGQGSGAAYQTVNDEDLAKAYAGGRDADARWQRAPRWDRLALGPETHEVLLPHELLQ